MREELAAHADVLEGEHHIPYTHGLIHAQPVAQCAHGPVGDEGGVLGGQDDGIEQEVLGDEAAEHAHGDGDGRPHEGPPELLEVLQEGHFLAVLGRGQS